MIHVFDTAHATLYGMAEAVIIANFQFWIGRNRANKDNHRDGRTWTYNSVKALSDLFPYLSEGQIRRALDHLVEKQVLVTGTYNERAVDRTKWYAFHDECKFLDRKMDLSPAANETVAGDKTVYRTDITPDGKPDTKRAKRAASVHAAGAEEKFDPLATLLAAGVAEQVARDWLEVRKQKRLPLTATAWEQVLADCEQLGMTPHDVVRTCCENGWGGFRAKWLQGGQQSGRQGQGSAFEQGLANGDEAARMLFGGDHAA